MGESIGYTPESEREVPRERVPDIRITRETAARLAQRAIDRIRENFDKSEGPDRLPYHGVRHTEGVRLRTRKILEALAGEDGVNVSERDFLVADLAAAAHDLVQEWNVLDASGARETVEAWRENRQVPGEVTRNRFRRTNEQASGAMMASWIEAEEEERGERAFTLEERGVLLRAIMATYPEFLRDRGTVWQPNLARDHHPVTFAVAMADLGEAGMSEDPQDYLDAGDAEFIEARAIDMLEIDTTNLNNKQRAHYRARMLGWTALQPVFARGQRDMFAEKIAWLPEGAMLRVSELFRYFDNTIDAATARIAARKAMTFKKLYADMGFHKLR